MANYPISCRRCHGAGVEPNNKAIGTEFRKGRMIHQYGLREMASKLGLSPAFLSQLERGERTWTDRVKKKYYKALLDETV